MILKRLPKKFLTSHLHFPVVRQGFLSFPEFIRRISPVGLLCKFFDTAKVNEFCFSCNLQITIQNFPFFNRNSYSCDANKEENKNYLWNQTHVL